MNEFNLVGEWKSCYFHDDGLSTTHTVLFKSNMEGVVGESLPQKDLTHLTLKLQYDSEGNVLTGTWKEVSSVKGRHKGKIFHGALQLIPEETGDGAKGLWVGYNESGTKINSGIWTLTKI